MYVYVGMSIVVQIADRYRRLLALYVYRMSIVACIVSSPASDDVCTLYYVAMCTYILYYIIIYAYLCVCGVRSTITYIYIYIYVSMHHGALRSEAAAIDK